MIYAAPIFGDADSDCSPSQSSAQAEAEAVQTSSSVEIRVEGDASLSLASVFNAEELALPADPLMNEFRRDSGSETRVQEYLGSGIEAPSFKLNALSQTADLKAGEQQDLSAPAAQSPTPSHEGTINDAHSPEQSNITLPDSFNTLRGQQDVTFAPFALERPAGIDGHAHIPSIHEHPPSGESDLHTDLVGSPKSPFHTPKQASDAYPIEGIMETTTYKRADAHTPPLPPVTAPREISLHISSSSSDCTEPSHSAPTNPIADVLPYTSPTVLVQRTPDLTIRPILMPQESLSVPKPTFSMDVDNLHMGNEDINPDTRALLNDPSPHSDIDRADSTHPSAERTCHPANALTAGALPDLPPLSQPSSDFNMVQTRPADIEPAVPTVMLDVSASNIPHSAIESSRLPVQDNAPESHTDQTMLINGPFTSCNDLHSNSIDPDTPRGDSHYPVGQASSSTDTPPDADSSGPCDEHTLKLESHVMDVDVNEDDLPYANDEMGTAVPPSSPPATSSPEGGIWSSSPAAQRRSSSPVVQTPSSPGAGCAPSSPPPAGLSSSPDFGVAPSSPDMGIFSSTPPVPSSPNTQYETDDFPQESNGKETSLSARGQDIDEAAPLTKKRKHADSETMDASQSHRDKRMKYNLDAPRPPTTKRNTAATLKEQLRKLKAPFRCPVVDPSKASTGTGLSAPAKATSNTDGLVGTPVPSTNKEGTLIAAGDLNRVKEDPKIQYRTARASLQFKSPLLASSAPGGSVASHPSSGVRLTPTIQTLQRQLQHLKRAVKIKQGNEEEELKGLVKTWKEAAREVAWEVWELYKERGGGPQQGAGGTDSSWGWEEKKGFGSGWGWAEAIDEPGEAAHDEDKGQQKPVADDADEEAVVRDDMGTMLRQLGVDPDTLGWDADQDCFVDSE